MKKLNNILSFGLMNSLGVANKKLIFILLLTIVFLKAEAQYATGGTGQYIDEIWWVKWSGVNNPIQNGDSVLYNLPNGVKLKLIISNVSCTNSKTLIPYNTGTWTGDKLDDFYSGINPIGLVSNAPVATCNFRITVSASFNSQPYSVDLILADAEDNGWMSSVGSEWLEGGTNGQPWQVLEIMPSTNPLNSQSVIWSNSGQTIRQIANVGNTIASFNPGGLYVSENATQLDIITHGTGRTAISVGVMMAQDFGDYSGVASASHLNNLSFTGGGKTDGTYTMDLLTEASIVFDINGPYLGTKFDSEKNDSLANGTADGDDIDNIDDEDGISILPNLTSGNYSVEVLVSNDLSTAANVYAWLDFDMDGSFDENERAILFDGSVALAGGQFPANETGTVILSWSGYDVSGFNPFDTTYLRVRLTTDTLDITSDGFSQDDASIGPASNGEVEDYALIFLCTDVNVIIDTVICQGDSITLGSITYDSSGTFVDTLITSFGCDSITILNLTVLDPQASLFYYVRPSLCGGTDGSIRIRGLDRITAYNIIVDGALSSPITTDGGGTYTIASLGFGDHTIQVSTSPEGCLTSELTITIDGVPIGTPVGVKCK